LFAFSVYAGFCVVCYGIIVMEGPKELWGHYNSPDVAVPVWCTVFLSVLFFAVYLIFAVSSLVKEIRARVSQVRFDNSNVVETTAFNAPMLCVLFIAARLRSLQVDPEGGKLQSWAPTCYYAICGAVVVQSLLAVIGLVMGVQLHDTASLPEPGKKGTLRLLRVVRDLALWVVWFCVVAIIYSLVTLGDDLGKKKPNMPPSLQCVIFLTGLYFFVLLLQMIMRAVRSVKPEAVFAKDENVEAKDAEGKWWPMKVQAVNPDGTYALSMDNYENVWPRVYPENMKSEKTPPMVPTVPQSGLDDIRTPVPAAESPSARFQKFLLCEAKDAVDLSPVLGVLFLAAFLRALQVTGGYGAPPVWSQYFMYIACVSIVLMIISQFDALYSRVSSSTKRICLMLRCIFMLILCTCMGGIMAALFVMNEKDATGLGSLNRAQL
jgi:hypothetical protein